MKFKSVSLETLFLYIYHAMKIKILLLLLLSTIVINCSSDSKEQTTISSDNETPEDQLNLDTIKLLSLGDSYTIGQSVCETCRFPEQLKSELESSPNTSGNLELQVIAQTGWTTTNLISAIESVSPNNDFDIVTLLIGVNNQFQGRDFSLYETEFPELVNTASTLASNNPSNVIVVSIPDYAYTPFGQGFNDSGQISVEIDQYNQFAEDYCFENGISYVYITDITREGLNNPELVASDGLHPSELAYSIFVDRILPIALEKLED